ncbi:hypothetical protein I302_105621 [Kwoniella bestiolae CBS 10118]|uniref:Uncharacterized protein n=1 Tax=Kwoniella bestiolae CBS 10118 TaxID=1296100 RepID=A0AAJ8K9U2_9TREE
MYFGKVLDTGDRQRLTRYSSSLADPIRSIEDLTILGNTGTLNGQSAATILSNINLNFANRHWGTPHAEELARLCAAGAIINLTERATRRESPAGVRSSLQDSSYPNQKTYDQPQYIYHAPTLTSGSGNLHSSTQRCSDERHHDHRVMMQMQSYGSDTNHGYSSSHNHNDDSCTAPPQSYYAQTFSTPLPQGTSGYPQSQLSNHGVIVTPQTPGPAYQIYYTDYNCCSSLALTGVTQAGSGGYAQTCTHVSSGETRNKTGRFVLAFYI